MTYRAMVDSQHKSPLKKRRMQNSSDAIQQEVSTTPFNDLHVAQAKNIKLKRLGDSFVFILPTRQFMDLRTRYTALVTLMTQCVKFASETLRRAEEEEVRLLVFYSWSAGIRTV